MFAQLLLLLWRTCLFALQQRDASHITATTAVHGN
jgi:hypothetical protein